MRKVSREGAVSLAGGIRGSHTEVILEIGYEKGQAFAELGEQGI